MRKTCFVVGALLVVALATPTLSQDSATKNINDQSVGATAWFQSSAEAQALFYQAYNVARLMLDHDVTTMKTEKKRAVIVDIDETVLDNSPHQATMIARDSVFPAYWKEWVDAAKAEALPGAVEFLQYAASKGIEVFYVSGRTQKDELEPTKKNLAARGFPFSDNAHLLFRTDESSKEKRRQSIADKYHIVLLMGDNLNDFSNVFERKSVADRGAEVKRLKEEFGKRFIVLPNPFYGDWESALFKYQARLTPDQRNRLRKESLKGF